MLLVQIFDRIIESKGTLLKKALFDALATRIDEDNSLKQGVIDMCAPRAQTAWTPACLGCFCPDLRITLFFTLAFQFILVYNK